MQAETQFSFYQFSQLAATRAAVRVMEEDEVNRQLTETEISSAGGPAAARLSRLASSRPATI